MDDLKSAVFNYQQPAESRDIVKRTRILFLVGTTGAGKDAVARQLIKTGHYRAIISHTTRKPRINHGVLEKDGVDYHFISVVKAKEMLKKQSFIEAVMTHGSMYATSLSELKDIAKESKIAVTDLDIKGVRVYHQLSDDIKMVFLLPPSFKILLDRLTSRYGKSHNQEEIRTRLLTALDELNELSKVHYYYVLVNDDIKKTTKAVKEIMAGNYSPKADPRAINLADELIKDIKKYLASS